MPTGIWLVAAAVVLVFGIRSWRRRSAHRLVGRTVRCRAMVLADGTLKVRRRRARLYGVGHSDGTPVDQVCGALRAAIGDGNVSLRIMAIDADGTWAVVLHCGGFNPAVGLLRTGLVRTKGTGARRYRYAQAAAQRDRLGIWRFAEAEPRREPQQVVSTALIFPWWQG